MLSIPTRALVTAICPASWLLCFRLSGFPDLQGSHGQLTRHSLSSLLEGGPTLDAATLPLPVRQAAFVEAADCFAALIAKPEVSCHRYLLS